MQVEQTQEAYELIVPPQPTERVLVNYELAVGADLSRPPPIYRPDPGQKIDSLQSYSPAKAHQTAARSSATPITGRMC
jgi:hypothetical protein